MVCGGQACADVGHEDDRVTLLDRQLGLVPDLGEERILVIRDEAAGVDDGEDLVAPLCIRVVAIPGHPGHILHQCQPPPG